MNIPSFDPSGALGYWTSGQDTITKMTNILETHSLTITYDQDNKKFTIPDSSHINKETIAKILSVAFYHSWKPQVLDETDNVGNWLVELRPTVSQPSSVQKTKTATTHNLELSKHRDNAAEELVSNIKTHLKVSFSGKTCLDIGCRSGENTLAMAKAGAQVIGIDPDDKEFEIAKFKGMTSEQLVKATLQEYHTTFPDKQFDIATVFLWNIPFLENEAICSALTQVIKPGGIVIISYYDEIYNDPNHGIPSLVSKFFGNVEKFIFSAYPQYVLKCSQPQSLCEK